MRSVSYFRPQCMTSGRYADIARRAGFEAFAVYVALCHGSTSHITGLTHALPGALARDTGLTIEGVEQALSDLESVGVLDRDTENGLVLLHGEFDRQCSQAGEGKKFSPKLIAAARNRVPELAFSPLAAAFARRHGIQPPPPPPPQQAEAGATGKDGRGRPRVSDTVSHTVSSAPGARSKRRRREEVGDA